MLRYYERMLTVHRNVAKVDILRMAAGISIVLLPYLIVIIVTELIIIPVGDCQGLDSAI